MTPPTPAVDDEAVLDAVVRLFERPGTESAAAVASALRSRGLPVDERRVRRVVKQGGRQAGVFLLSGRRVSVPVITAQPRRADTAGAASEPKARPAVGGGMPLRWQVRALAVAEFITIHGAPPTREQKLRGEPVGEWLAEQLESVASLNSDQVARLRSIGALLSTRSIGGGAVSSPSIVPPSDSSPTSSQRVWAFTYSHDTWRETRMRQPLLMGASIPRGLRQAQVGDLAVCYARKGATDSASFSGIVGLSRITTMMFESHDRVWATGVFPYRVEMELIAEWPLASPESMISLVNDLALFPGKKVDAAVAAMFRGAPKRWQPEDGPRIVAYLLALRGSKGQPSAASRLPGE